MSTTYLVEVKLETKGNLTAGIDKVGAGAKAADVVVSKLSTGFDKASAGAGKLFDMFDGVVSKVIDVGLGMAKWGGLAAAGAVTYGVVHLNNELEQTKIALGAIFEANGIAGDLPTGMRLAQETIAKMRIDAQKLPGEFGDLKNIFTTVAIPGFQAGASVDQLREMSGKLMAFGIGVAHLPVDQVAREAAMLLEGRSGAHNALGMKLAALGGDQAKAFNHESAAKRFADVDKYLDKYKDSIDEFGKSWEGISSTTVDFGKQWLSMATEPVFDKAKGELLKINEWFTGNRELVNSWADYIGDKLGDGFDYAVVKIEEWWPAVEAFGENAYNKLKSIWDDIEPSVKSFGESLQNALKDPGTIDKLVHLAELWGTGKVVGATIGAVGSAVQVGLGGAMVAKHMGWIGGAAGAAEAGGATAGAAAEAGGAGIGLDALGALGGVLLPAIGLLAGGLTVLTEGVYAAYNIYSQFSAVQQLDTDARSVAIEKLVNGTASMSENVKAFDDASEGYLSAHNELMTAALDAASAVSGMAAAMSEYKNEHNKDIGARVSEYLSLIGVDVGTRDNSSKRKLPSHPGGGGGTHIAKIEITVSGNDEPNRVAALVVDKINKQTRHRRTSPDVQSFSRGG